jgi:hypothetical protein
MIKTSGRRNFLKQAGFGTAGLVIGFSLDNYTKLLGRKELESLIEIGTLAGFSCSTE